MPSKTTNYGLIKPNEDEFYDVQVQNGNMDIIDHQIKSNADGLGKIGELTDLQTSNKSTLVSAINEVFQAGNSVKSDVVTALLSIDPSLPITTESTWAKIEAAITEVQTGVDTSDATATVAQILSDATAYVKGNKVTGTMPNRGAITSSLNAGSSYTIPEGYHNGNGKLIANSLASQTVADATAANILSGKTAWVNGQKITGTIPIKAAETITPGTTNKSYGAGYYNAFTVVGDTELIASNITYGTNIFGVTGTNQILKKLIPGSRVLYSHRVNDPYTGYGYGDPSPMNSYNIRLELDGVVRVSFDARLDDRYDSGAKANFQIYKNGQPFGILRVVTTNVWTTYTEDITVSAGDLINVWGNVVPYDGDDNKQEYKNFYIRIGNEEPPTYATIMY